LPSPTKDSSHPSTLPPEDLNPLVNPLLAQNMGRWAEVYFTSLPENRDQAVTDLLLELREQAATAQADAPPDTPAAPGTVSPLHAPAAQGEDVSALMLRCPECGHENRNDHNFCGACRAQLRGEAGAYPHLDPYVDAALTESQFDDARSDAGLHGAGWNNGARSRQEPEQNSAPTFQSRDANFDQRGIHSEGYVDDLGKAVLRQSDRRQQEDRRKNDRSRNDNSRNDPQKDNAADLFRFSTPAPTSRYRLYAGIVIALAIAFLLYRGWSSGYFATGASHSAPQLPPSTTESSESSAGTSAPASATPGSNAPAATAPNASFVAKTDVVKTGAVKTGAALKPVPSETDLSKSPAGTPAGATATGAPQLLSDNGSPELAQAKIYLNGTDGKPRDSAEAATLLWKAVAKQNAEATELLGNLYLKGDGVSKNCDQGRLLLDAAARKGRKDAAEGLGHLQAFGCQ
jgi:hypothetical protein